MHKIHTTNPWHWRETSELLASEKDRLESDVYQQEALWSNTQAKRRYMR